MCMYVRVCCYCLCCHPLAPCRSKRRLPKVRGGGNSPQALAIYKSDENYATCDYGGNHTHCVGTHSVAQSNPGPKVPESTLKERATEVRAPMGSSNPIQRNTHAHLSVRWCYTLPSPALLAD